MASTLADLRAEVRCFLAGHEFEPQCDSWMRGSDPAFSRELGTRGWIGMTVPPQHGGGGRSFVERLAVTEELLRAGAPVAAHWIADRQIAPILVGFGSERLRRDLLPPICRGELYFCVGMSEPNAGSDVAAISTAAKRRGDRWVVNGQKVWTTGAQVARYCYLIARTSRDAQRRHEGLSEFVVPMDADGVTVRPIEDLSGQQHFAEVFFDEVELESWQLVGEPGNAFKQVIKQLDYERSGPERFLSTYRLFESLGDTEGGSSADLQSLQGGLGVLGARFVALRRLALDLAEEMDTGQPPSAMAALVKEAGTALEQDVVRVAADWLEVEPWVALGEYAPDGDQAAARELADALRFAPAFTLRGGTSEILREVVGRRMLGLGSDR